MAARRQRLITSNATPHHSASQNTGWVIADISLDNTNMQTFCKTQGRKKEPNGPFSMSHRQVWRPDPRTRKIGI
jgi:hypothetical protein